MPEVNLWNKALDILSRREHSISQLKSKIQKFQDNEEQIEELINKLIDKDSYTVARVIELEDPVLKDSESANLVRLIKAKFEDYIGCLLYTSPSPRD